MGLPVRGTVIPFSAGWFLTQSGASPLGSIQTCSPVLRSIAVIRPQVPLPREALAVRCRHNPAGRAAVCWPPPAGQQETSDGTVGTALACMSVARRLVRTGRLEVARRGQSQDEVGLGRNFEALLLESGATGLRFSDENARVPQHYVRPICAPKRPVAKLDARVFCAYTGVTKHLSLVSKRLEHRAHFRGMQRDLDDSFTMMFDDLNRNYEGKIDVPIGPIHFTT